MPRFRDHLELHVSILGLSMTAIFGKLITMNVVQTISARAAIAAATLMLVLRWRGRTVRIRPNADARWNILAGVMLALHWVAFFQAVRTGTVAMGLLGLFTFPVMLTLVEPWLFHERFRGWSLVHGVLVLAGLSLVVPRWNLQDADTMGLLWGILAAVFYVGRNLLSRRLIQAHGSMRVMLWQVLVTALVLSPAWAWRVRIDWPTDMIWLALLGVVCTAGAHTMFVASFRHFRVATASIVLTLEPVYAVLLAILILGEWPRWQTWLGGAILLVVIAHESYRDAKPVPLSEASM